MHSINTYDSTHTLIAQGAEMVWNMSIEAAYLKLLLAYGNFTDTQQITDFMATDRAGELIFVSK
jgi:L-asparaginase